MRCPHCPARAGLHCPGEGSPALCERVTPGHPRHNPPHVDSIRDLAEQLHAREYPSPARQAASLAASLWEWATSGFRTAGDAEQARRRAICEGCPRWAAAARRCTLCGCYTEAKIRLKTERCPEGRW
jgi:hypothetical protein